MQSPFLKHRSGIRAIVAFLGSVAVSWAGAEERILYRSVLPSGQIIYGDAPVPRAKSNEAVSVEPHPPDQQAAETAQRALGLTRAQLLRDADARAARTRQLDNEIAEVASRLRVAELARERAREIQEGDRQGRWLLASYVQRQTSLQVEVDRLSRQLDRLVRERRVLQT